MHSKNRTNLTGVTIPNSVKNLGGDAFAGCSSLANVTIGTNITSIGYGTFSYCSSLTSVTIPSSVTNITSFAFDNCARLISVTIDNTSTNAISITADAFADNPGLTGIYFEGNPPGPDSTVFYSDNNVKAFYLLGNTNWSSTFDGTSDCGVAAANSDARCQLWREGRRFRIQRQLA